MPETLLVRNVASGQVEEATDFAELHAQLEGQTIVPLRTDGTPARVQQLGGGYLIDGAPINVVLSGEWDEGQAALLEPYWQAGTIPRPPNAPEPDTAAEDPPATEEATGRATDSPKIGLLVAAGVLGFLLGRRV